MKCVGTCIRRKPNQAVEDKLEHYEVSRDHLEHSMFGAQHLTHEQQHLYIHCRERWYVGHTSPIFPRHPHHLVKTKLNFTRMLEAHRSIAHYTGVIPLNYEEALVQEQD